jgi:hypothetical protein
MTAVSLGRIHRQSRQGEPLRQAVAVVVGLRRHDGGLAERQPAAAPGHLDRSSPVNTGRTSGSSMRPHKRLDAGIPGICNQLGRLRPNVTGSDAQGHRQDSALAHRGQKRLPSSGHQHAGGDCEPRQSGTVLRPRRMTSGALLRGRTEARRPTSDASAGPTRRVQRRRSIERRTQRVSDR